MSTKDDDFSDFIGYSVVAQKIKANGEKNKSYCPGIINSISKSNKLIIKFGDNEKLELPSSNLFINDPDDINESNKYYLNLASIYSINTSVLADIEYNQDFSNYQYGKISSYDQASGTCNVIFNKFGIIKNIPLSSIITPCDNRYITGVIDKKNDYFVEDEAETVLSERACAPIESNDNITMKIENNQEINIKKKEKKKVYPYMKYLLILNIFVLLLTILIISFNFNYFFSEYLQISGLSFINYLWVIIWILLISFSLGPFYLIYWIIIQLLDIFSFKVSFCLSCYLGGESPFNYQIYILILILCTTGYVYLLKKNFKNLRLNSKKKRKVIPSTKINMGFIENNLPTVSSPNLNILGQTVPPDESSSEEFRIPNL